MEKWISTNNAGSYHKLPVYKLLMEAMKRGKDIHIMHRIILPQKLCTSHIQENPPVIHIAV